MKGGLHVKDKQGPHIIKVLGLALGLPSTILGIFGLLYYLMKEGYVSPIVAISILVAVISYTFFLMIKYANKK